MTILAIIILGLYGLCNLIVYFSMPLRDMAEDFWKGQKIIGKITCTVLYAPAWIFKGIAYGFAVVAYYLLWGCYWLFMRLFSMARWLYNKARKGEL